MSQGGARKGAGRPPGDPDLVKVPVGYKLPRWLVEWLREQDMPAARLIEDALCRRHKLRAPNTKLSGTETEPTTKRDALWRS